MLVYASQPASRLIYILEFVSKELFDDSVQITTDRQVFLDHGNAKINYSSERIGSEALWINSHGLLFQEGLHEQDVTCFMHNGSKAFFPIADCDYSFDIFAACFYLVSRYEEYLPHHNDRYGRYAHTNSLAFKESFLHLPLVNIWLTDFRKTLSQKFPQIIYSKQSFRYIPTYDIDIAWSYRNKGWWRNAGGFMRSLLQFNWNAAGERLNVLLKKQLDPFDSYGWLDKMHEGLHVQPMYFFLLAATQKGYDKNISPSNRELQQLIESHHAKYAVGIHPSWQSGDDNRLLRTEIENLNQLLKTDIVNSRQHYLRFKLPLTYRNLVCLGIKNEYSMGYGTINGFRASVASSFKWYDLLKESATGLLVHPFCFMDASAYYELKLSPEAALGELIELYNSVHAVNGTMITLWHNNFLGTDRSFEGWRVAYEQFLRYVSGADFSNNNKLNEQA